MFQRSGSWRARLSSFALVLLLASTLATLGTFITRTPQAHATDSPNGTTILLVHGFDDTCNGAFNSTNSGGMTTVDYLRAHGWKNIDTVGYYNIASDPFGNKIQDTPIVSDPAQGCTAYLSYNNDSGSCSGYYRPTADAPNTLDDPIQDLGCVLAWYIYDNYTSKGKPVVILAHSMGGLIVRDAIGQAGPASQLPGQAFPPKSIDVRRVVTVATPHGGLSGWYATAGWWGGGLSAEVSDMIVGGGGFIDNVAPKLNKPQGAHGTFWGLIAASDPIIPSGPIASLLSACLPTPSSTVPTGSAYSCVAFQNGPPKQSYPWYPDGDGVVQASSALEMPADYKVLYGEVDSLTPTTTAGEYQDTHYTADTATAYEHEYNACAIGFCLVTPFYLNDGTSSPSSDTGLTSAWICSSNCSTDDFSQLNLSGGAKSVWHALAEITWLLAPSTHYGPGQVTNYSTPGMTNWNGKVWVCWADSNNALHVGYITNPTNSSSIGFTPVSMLSDTSYDGCSLAPFNNRLYLAFTGTNGVIYVVSTTDGSNWGSFPHTALSNTSMGGAQIAVFNNKLYLTFTGTNNVVYLVNSLNSDASSFGNQQSIYWPGGDNQGHSAAGPAINAILGQLFIAFSNIKANGIDLVSYNGSSFTNSIVVTDTSGTSPSTYSNPALTNVQTNLVLGWQGEDSQSHLNVTWSSDGSTFSNTDTLADSCNQGPAMAAINNQLVWAWSGTDSPPHLYVAAEY